MPSNSYTKYKSVPLCVDLDGTLIKTDSLHELFIQLLKKNPLYCFISLLWLLKSKAFFKQEITKRVQLSPNTLPYNQEILEYIKAQDSEREILLVTGSNQKVAGSIFEYLNLFDEVIASDSNLNLTGDNKRKVLTDRFGENGFEYIGNDKADTMVWADCKYVSVVSKENNFLKQVRRSFSVHKEFILPTPSIGTYLKAIRIHQWVKNLLVFVPLVLAHQFGVSNALFELSLTFICFSLVTSFTYIVNDLLDLESDRLNQYKKSRSFASSLISIKHATLMMLILLFAAVFLLGFLSTPVALVLLVYVITTLSYSFYFKRIAILDVIILAGLFSLRIIAGIVTINSGWSFWLLAFSMFFFLSLAFAKRFSEVNNLRKEGMTKALGRGYSIEDLPMLNISGVAAGYISILVVALYINSEKVRQMYTHPEILWLICPLLLYWIGRIWLITGRGNMHEDPIVFAIKDKVSLLIVLLCGAILIGAKLYSG